MENLIPAITIYQPWASLIIEGLKQLETRRHARFASLVGKHIAIHAGTDRRWLRTQNGGSKFINHIINLRTYELITEEKLAYLKDWFYKNREALPMGCILGSAYLNFLTLLEAQHSSEALNDCRGNNTYGLHLVNPSPYPKPIPAKGKQGIWYWNPLEAVPVSA